MSFTSPATGMLLLASLHHGQSSYATTSPMANAITLQVSHSGRPFSYTWHNVESLKSTVAASSSTSTPLPVQSWCLTTPTAAALYTGFVQCRSNSLLSNDPSVAVGDVVVRYKCQFRTRV
jgi:hypothetical protein